MTKRRKMTAEDDERQQNNIDRLRELLERNGGVRDGTPPEKPRRRKR